MISRIKIENFEVSYDGETLAITEKRPCRKILTGAKKGSYVSSETTSYISINVRILKRIVELLAIDLKEFKA